MREDAVLMNVLGVEVYAFGLWVALGLALALGLLALLGRKMKWKQGAAPLFGALALALGFVFSRLLYCFLDESLGCSMPLWAIVQVNIGGYSIMGALLGACLAAVIAGKIAGMRAARLMDCLAPAFLLMVVFERGAESLIEGFGQSRALTMDFFINSFLAAEGDDGYYLATYRIEAFAAAALCVVLVLDLKKQRRAGDTFIKFMLLFGATQIILESLRYDQHMTVRAFVRVEQILSMALLGFGVITLAIRNWKKRFALSLSSVILIPIVVGIGVGIEFMLDRTGINRLLLYAVFSLAVAVPAWLGLRLRREA